MNRCAQPSQLALIAITALAAACDRPSSGVASTPVAARINGAAITVAELNAAMPAQPADSTNASNPMSKAVLDQLIRQRLLVQKAQEARVDRDPQVMLALESAKRAVLADEWLRRTVTDSAPPSDVDIMSYYNQHPELFSGRRAFTFQLAVVDASADQLPKIQEQLAKFQNFDRLLEYLRANKVNYVTTEWTRTSEQLPADFLHRFDNLKAGDIASFPSGDGIELVRLLSTRAESIDEPQAHPLIAKILQQQRRTERAEDAITSLRATARIELTMELNSQSNAFPSPRPAPDGIVEGIASGIK